jgi:hypothetical protein
MKRPNQLLLVYPLDMSLFSTTKKHILQKKPSNNSLYVLKHPIVTNNLPSLIQNTNDLDYSLNISNMWLQGYNSFIDNDTTSFNGPFNLYAYKNTQDVSVYKVGNGSSHGMYILGYKDETAFFGSILSFPAPIESTIPEYHAHVVPELPEEELIVQFQEEKEEKEDDRYNTIASRTSVMQFLESVISKTQENGESWCFKVSGPVASRQLQVLNTLLKQSYIGEDSAEGEIMTTCYPRVLNENGQYECAEDNVTVVVKLVALSTIAETSELISLRLCQKLVIDKICPNLPLLINHFECNDCLFKNKRLKQLSKKNCYIYLMDFVNGGTLWNWGEKKRSTAEWYNMYFQVFVGLYALQKYFNMSHHDLHPDNIMFYSIQPGGYWKYIIDDNTYYLPNLGFIFILWDFSFGLIPTYTLDVNLETIENIQLDDALRNAKLQNIQNRIKPVDNIEYKIYKGPQDRPYHVNDYRRMGDVLYFFNDKQWQRNKKVRSPPKDVTTSLYKKIRQFASDQRSLSFILVNIFSYLYYEAPRNESLIETYNMNVPITFSGSNDDLNVFVTPGMKE